MLGWVARGLLVQLGLSPYFFDLVYSISADPALWRVRSALLPTRRRILDCRRAT
jgi:hypothetical protein